METLAAPVMDVAPPVVAVEPMPAITAPIAQEAPPASIQMAEPVPGLQVPEMSLPDTQMPGFGPPTLNLPEQGPPNPLWEAETRFDHLQSLPNIGFVGNEFDLVTQQITDIGLPVNNFTSLIRQPNESGEERTLASWGIGTENFGQYSIYDLLNTSIPEKRLSTLTHESAHASSPLNPNNAYLFGGEAERLEAVNFALDATNQSLATKVHLDGYHEELIAKYKAKDITKATLVEETNAILAEMAIANRGGLAEKQRLQHKELEDINRIRRLKGEEPLPKISLLSKESPDGLVLDGVDKTLVTLINGVNSAEELVTHSHALKANAHFYMPENARVARQRETARGYKIYEHTAIDGIAGVIHQKNEDEAERRRREEETNKQQAKDQKRKSGLGFTAITRATSREFAVAA